jgi:hypothetical protein
MERQWIHPSELPALNDATALRRRAGMIVVAASLVIIAGIVATATLKTSVTKPGVGALVHPARSLAKAPVVGVVDSQGHHELGAVINHGAMIAVPRSHALGSRMIITTMGGAKVLGTIVATDSYLGVSMVKLDSALPSEHLVHGTLRAMASQPVEIISGTSPRFLTLRDATVTQATASVANQDLGVLRTSMSASGAGVVTTRTGIPEALVLPHLGSHIAVPLATIEQRARMHTRGGQHGWLQISVSSVATGGVGVVRVGTASSQTLRLGDRILAIDGDAIASIGDLLDHLYAMPAGTCVTLRLERAGVSVTENVVLASHP